LNFTKLYRMGKFKDEHGKTRIGSFLKTVAPELLNVASTLTGIDSLKELSGVISGNNIITPKDKETALKLIERDIQDEKEVTERWKADMNSDSWLSKSIRPLVVGWLILFTSIIIVLDSLPSVNFIVKDVWVTLLSTLLVTVIVAYFGSRGYEKGKKIISKRNK